MKNFMLLSVLLVVACGGEDSEPSTPDAMAMDGALDAMLADASGSDADVDDAEVPDAMAMDAASPDAASPDASLPDGGGSDAGFAEGGIPMLTCPEVETVYGTLVGPPGMRCGMGDTCHVLDGHCSVGLGGCYYAVTTTVTQESLDEVRSWWVGNGCDEGAGVCDCGPRPSGAACVMGRCQFVESM